MTYQLQPYNPDVAPARGITPCGAIRPVTPSDGADLPNGPCRFIIASEAGTVSITDLTGTKIDDLFLVAGPNPYAAQRIWNDSTITTLWAGYN